ncbi:MAG: 3-deoxy-7-phosphoheptulonate synthase [Chlamydiia bacterium]|nr:3-deoxy-7-phosphoheptulonate synthase [Chlamydiia bacterium]
MAPLISPGELKQLFPSHPFPKDSRRIAKQILRREDPRVAVLVGPCSIHDPASAIEYAKRLKSLSEEVSSHFYLIMRFFIEKPRTSLGWKGILYDPGLNGSNDIETGLKLCRQLLLEIASLGVPCCTELLEPLVTYYIDDLLTWGLIGARTSNSQPHRQLASGLNCPVGFKNDLYGQIDSALFGTLAARSTHSHLGIDQTGHACIMHTQGNPFSHLVLRGSDQAPNYDLASVQKALEKLQKIGLEENLLIDCSHGNSAKDPELQKIAFQSVLEYIVNGYDAIAGLMLESHLFPGKQQLTEDPSQLIYGVSITDSCLSWEETGELLLRGCETLSAPTSISGVQN